VKKDETIFHQGDRADALFYLISGRIRYSVSSPSGKDAMLFVFADGDFFGERCLTERGSRFGTACALTEAVIVRLDKKEAHSRLLRDQAFGELLFSKMLERAHEYEEVLVLHISSITANSALPPCSCAWRAITATITNACE
jgi:CRP/FNR family cyclic AMP-dependent transcriptional regulator